MGARILVAEDDFATSTMVTMALRGAGYRAAAARSLRQARQLLSSQEFDLILCDLYLGDGTGLDLLKEARGSVGKCPFILFTAQGSLEAAVEAMEEGAYDFLAKPFGVDELRQLVAKALGSRKPSSSQERVAPSSVESSLMIGNSPPMVDLYKKIALVAPTDTAVLITGETGTGKELVARSLHNFSSRKDRPFAAVNCGALTETLLEAELFGHERGAFTGAVATRKGLFESASGSTLFLDEITETSAAFQVKLLRVLQEGEIRPVGSNRTLDVDVRVVTASNSEVQKALEEGKLREDLYYRLSVVQLEIPPLRERPQDIPLLVRHFLTRIANRLGREISISSAAIRRLTSYSWPGNVRELENVLERTAVLRTNSHIEEGDLDFHNKKAPLVMGGNLTELERLERQAISQALKQTGGNRAEAARRLGIGRKTLYRKAKKLGIDLGEYS
jgi:DNA-binding NtrC family response regulator